MSGDLYFCLWYGPQYPFAYGFSAGTAFEITWLEKKGKCNLEYSNLAAMFQGVCAYQGWECVEGLAFTVISEEMYISQSKVL